MRNLLVPTTLSTMRWPLLYVIIIVLVVIVILEENGDKTRHLYHIAVACSYAEIDWMLVE